MKLTRHSLVATHDLFMTLLAAELSVAFSFALNDQDWTLFAVPVYSSLMLLFALPVYWHYGLYRGIWHYASTNDFFAIVRAVAVTLGGLVAVGFIVWRLEEFPRSALMINGPLLVVLLTAPRLLWRMYRDGDLAAVFKKVKTDRVPVLLVGAGDEADAFIRAMKRPKSPYSVSGILSRSKGRVGRDIRGVPVLGMTDDIDQVMEKLERPGIRPRRLIITSKDMEGSDMRALLERAEALGLSMARLPRVTDFQKGAETGQIETRPVDVEDLLGRPQRVLDRSPVETMVQNKTVLVTGAGGSIGGELTRQLAALGPKELILFENGEFALYKIEQEIGRRWPDVRKSHVLGDVRDRERVFGVFDRFRPDLVFHAAAFKHVPLVEDNPNEGILTNVVGSRNVADAAIAHGCDGMVMISTDKAVNPTSIMGASKRVAEMYCQAQAVALGKEKPPHFVTVRFGNVLGSTGSVVPLFQQQIRQGGPVTVTHKDMTRYFMTIREAVELVLQSAAMKAGQKMIEEPGRIFTLDMGEPVLIDDLARQMILLSGLTPDKDIDIVYSGLRPGEKLYEEVYHDGEVLEPTPIDGVNLAAPRIEPLDSLTARMDALVDAATNRDTAAAKAQLYELVPEFIRN